MAGYFSRPVNSRVAARSPKLTMTLNRRLLLAAFLAAVLLPATGIAATASAPAKADPIDRILIVVNEDIITASEVSQRLASVRRRLQEQNVTPPPEAVLRRQVMEHMVVERLQVQLARLAGIKISEEQLDRAIQTFAERRRLTVEELRNRIAQDPGGVDAFRNELRDQLLAQKLVEREVTHRVSVSEAEIDEVLASRASRGTAVEYNLSHILITVPESASPEKIAEARNRAEAVHRELAGGADFKQLAVANSQGQNALEGGGLGWRSDGQLPELFVEALRKINPGEVSPVLRSANGFHILRLNDRRGGNAAVSVTQTHARHILLRINELSNEKQTLRRASELRERLLSGTDFGETARARSDDLASAANGGELGWVLPGQTVPEFEQAMNALKPGEISKPVKTQFGIHLIQVLERREQDMSHERERARARSEILARKSDERLDMWLRQLRDEAFVEYRTGSPDDESRTGH